MCRVFNAMHQSPQDGLELQMAVTKRMFVTNLILGKMRIVGLLRESVTARMFLTVWIIVTNRIFMHIECDHLGSIEQVVVRL